MEKKNLRYQWHKYFKNNELYGIQPQKCNKLFGFSSPDVETLNAMNRIQERARAIGNIPFEVKEIRGLYNKNKSCRVIGEICGTSTETVKRWLIKDDDEVIFLPLFQAVLLRRALESKFDYHSLDENEKEVLKKLNNLMAMRQELIGL
jgi:hypothetical protein